MGKGRGFEFNLEFILRIVELILLVVALALLLVKDNLLTIAHSFASQQQAQDALNMSASIYIIILVIMILLQLIKKLELDPTFVGVTSSIGAVLLIASGIAYCVLSNNRGYDGYGGSSNGLISGILGIFGGLTLILDALKDFGVF